MKSLCLAIGLFVTFASCRKSQPLAPIDWPFDIRYHHQQQGRDRISAEYEEEIAFIPKPYASPFNRRDAMPEPPVKADQVYDTLISNLTASSFDRILRVNWNRTRDPFHYEGPDDIATVDVESISFEAADNITRVGYATAALVQGNANEIVLTGHIRIPVPKITFSVNVTTKDGQSSTSEATAIASRDVVMAVQLIMNKQWKQIFVTNITPKDAVIFRGNSKCDSEQTFDFCKQVQEILNREIISRIDASIRDALKFKLQELEPDT